ncbi:MAG: FimV/HubP family polar landmark protein [Brachymonas sp.]|nr:FimV/HubP family polar landmark protein [Brachymonas sp.]
MKNRSKSAKGILAQPRLSMVAALVAACIGTEAQALGFGRMKVQSALGQPLRAEIELIDAKSGNLRAGMAAPSVYVQKGLEYGQTVKGIRASVRKMPNGRAVLVLSSDAPINDPFVDVVLQASDGTGSVTRDFSLLLDPPSAPAPVNVVEPATPRALAEAKPVRRAERMALPPAEGEAGTEAQAPARRKRAAAASRGRTRSGAVRVRRGDTAGQIAARNRPARVSLDQMLVALQRANSHAFINGNVNLLKSGVVLKMPSAAEVRAVPAAEARAIIVAQSEDFRAYRGQLARAPMVQAAPSAQQSSGKIHSRIEDSKTSAAAAPDTLTISKAEVKPNSATEQRMAEALQKRDNVNRADELNKNLSDLKNISAEVAASAQPGTPPAVVPPTTAAAETPAMGASGVVAPIIAPVEAAASQAAAAAGEAASAAVMAASDAAAAVEQVASEAASAASEAESAAVTPSKKPVAPPPPPPPVEEPSFFEGLTGNPLLLGGVGLAALGGLAYAFMRRRRQNQEQDDGSGSSFFESNYAPDSFFHVSGGKDVDTSEATTTSGASSVNQSSMLYSPSQLDADADVDPVAEADVYLAYGRDIQAEEILKDALLKQPDNVSVHAKLLEVYARRRDVKAYAQAATEFKRLTQGEGTEWDIVRAKGAEIDPGNALYAESASGGQGAAPASAQAAAVGAAAATAAAASAMQAATVAPISQQPAEAPKPAFAPAQPNQDFDLKNLSPATVPVATRASLINRDSEQAPALDLSLDMDMSEPARPAAPAAEALAPSSQGLEFSMSGLSLDSEQPAEAVDSQGSDPLATKLALAREFMGIGDNEGARIMAQEVAQNATGGLKAQAEALLESLR